MSDIENNNEYNYYEKSFDNPENEKSDSTDTGEEISAEENIDYGIDSKKDGEINSNDSLDPFNNIDTQNGYEVSFDTLSGETEYKLPSDDTNGKDSQDNSDIYAYKEYREEKKPSDKGKSKLGVAGIVISTIAILASAFTLFMCLYTLREVNNIDNTNSSQITPPVVDYSKETNANGDSTVWVNPTTIDYNDALANATSKVIDSVVIIESFSNISTSDLDKADSAGSGVVWKEGDGVSYIVTCNHVVDGAKTLKVTLNNGKTHTAKVVGQDLRTDIAVISINAIGLKTITLPSDDTDLRLGQTVIAIGNPLGQLANSVTSGCLSGLTRSVAVKGIRMELLQIDAAVNGGNSGGGLFDINGELIGIVNAKTVDYSVEGIGFAIPFKTVKKIGEELINQGYVSGRPSLGIEAKTITSSNYDSIFAEEPGLKEYATKKSQDFFGRTVTTVITGVYVTDAENVKEYVTSSRFRYGDRITSVDGISVSTYEDIESALTRYDAGDTIEVTIMRGNKSVVVQAVLNEAGK